MKRMTKEIYDMYAEDKEPGAITEEEVIKLRKPAGGPTTKQRMDMRNQCKPKGPLGYLLESLYLQTASVDGNFVIKQFNQPDVSILGAPYQHIRPVARQMATRNRTRAAEGGRGETKDLTEIDGYATNASSNIRSDEELMILNTVRSGSAWNKAIAYNAGQVEDNLCQLCVEKTETTEHLIWTCSKLKAERQEADKFLAGIDVEILPPAVRYGIAPAMNADPRRMYWGGEKHVQAGKEVQDFCGCDSKFEKKS